MNLIRNYLKDLKGYMDKQIKELKECIDRSANTVAVTGAGISVSSGGMTFSHSSQKARVADLNIRRGADEVFDELFQEED